MCYYLKDTKISLRLWIHKSLHLHYIANEIGLLEYKMFNNIFKLLYVTIELHIVKSFRL